MNKKIFILTGEPSGDKLASRAISKLKSINNNIKYLSVGGENLKLLNIKSLYDLKEITFLGFTKVLFNIFKIKKKINNTTEEIIKFNPNILFSVDSPDFTLRVAKKVKKANPSVKTIHFVSPKVYVWRKNRVRKLKSYLDHILLLFPFEKKYFQNEDIKSTFVGHPFLDIKEKNDADISRIINKKKKIISLFPGSRLSEINILMPILIQFIKLSQNNNYDFLYAFHSTKEFKNLINKFLSTSSIENYEIISDENIKEKVLGHSIFAIAKSGTISLEICNAGIPSIIIYKINKINFFIIKRLVKIRFANIFNIIANSEIIPELLQSNCNHKKIYEVFNLFMNNSDLRSRQITKFNEILSDMKSHGSSSENVANILNNEL